MSQASQSEFEAILHGAAVARIDRAFLRITGSDATRWLNGMVTNSIQALQPGEGNYNFLLNAQGRIQGDCIIYREPGDEPTFLLETDRSQLEAVQQMLDRFIIMDDVELTEGLAILGSSVVGISLLGANSPNFLRSFLMEVGENDTEHFHVPQSGTMSYADGPHRHPLFLVDPNKGVLLVMTPALSIVPRFELWFQTDKGLQQLQEKLESAGAIPVNEAALEAFRIYSGTPNFGTDIRERDLPQETNQTQALHFAKGCYLGQEIVERIRSRGQVHRLFTRFRLEGELPTSFPAALESDGKPAGELTSAALVPLPEGPQLYALGYARREFLELKKTFTYAGGTAISAPASQN